jgi:hypothetical protein
MSHFDIGDWIDYVRGIAGEAVNKDMAAHLKAGCAECLDSYRWLNGVREVASLSTAAAVPENLTRRAERLFEPPSNFSFKGLLPLSAKVVFDAGCVVQPFGLRTAGSTNQAVYEAGEFTIDLRQETSRGSARIEVTGQISDGQNLDRDDASYPVALVADDVIVSNVITNRFGEFSLNCARRPNLKLVIAIAEAGRRIDIPLMTRNSRTKSIAKEP